MAYFVRLLENEIAATDEASCDKARLIHLELALRCSMKASRKKRNVAMKLVG
jgi:hypothetical protein